MSDEEVRDLEKKLTELSHSFDLYRQKQTLLTRLLFGGLAASGGDVLLQVARGVFF